MKKPTNQANAAAQSPEAQTPQADESSPTPSRNDSESSPEAMTMVSEEELKNLRAKVDQAQAHWDHLLRTTAEFDNYRKRAVREKEEAVRYANHKLLERLLPVLDSFDMAITAATAENADSSKALREGIQLVQQQFRSALKDAGLEEIEAQGKPFDPNLHEAVSQMETEEIEEGHVAQQIRKGYLLRDRLVRPSSVIVARKPAA